MKHEMILQSILNFYPDIQGVYLFGSYDTGNERPDSDIDLALLLPFHSAVRSKDLPLSPCRVDLETKLGRNVDLINLRMTNTVLQNKILNAGRLIFVHKPEAIREFEMRVLSDYQKLNEERKDILEDFHRSGRAYRI
ncbi:MAG: nucleotidyltransferase domain-containing protein [Nitrosomonas sp.]|nr:nucleotidyltransferase domain-containing protein [Nitrosomonas sp.]